MESVDRVLILVEIWLQAYSKLYLPQLDGKLWFNNAGEDPFNMGPKPRWQNRSA